MDGRINSPYPVAIIIALVLLCIGGNSAQAETLHPLAPPDTSSPRATLETFLQNMNDAVASYKSGRREKATARAKWASRYLDLEKQPPAIREVLGLFATLHLKETLDRINIPPYNEIPDAAAVKTDKISAWTIPETEITIALVPDPPNTGRFLFTGDTVGHIEQYYNLVKNLPYTGRTGDGALLDKLSSGSWLFSDTLLEHLPGWTKIDFHSQAIWQWIGLVLYFSIGMGLAVLLHKWSNEALRILDKRFHTNLCHTLGGLVLPVNLVVFSEVGLWFIVYGLHFLNIDVYQPTAFVFLLISYGGWIWLIAAALNRIADVFVSMSGFVRGGVDDQLIRLGFQTLTAVIVAVMILSLGARLGLPTYSLITGLGIGGLAVALAGREALSNIIGTIMIILDRPFKLGDYIVLEDGHRGEVAEVGLRSTRIRTRDDVLISIPNSVIANAKMINESAPLSIFRIRIKLGLAYDSNLKKVEQVLLRIAGQNEMVLPEPSPRMRFRQFGDSALELELLCWIADPEHKGRTTHQLNWAIKEEFELQGIELPFPQREVHLRSEK